MGVLVGLVFLGVGLFLGSMKLSEAWFVLSDLPRWQEAEATVLSVSIASSDTERVRTTDTKVYFTYTVLFDLTLSFETVDGPTTVDYLATATGSGSTRQLPADLSTRFKADTRERIVYDPDSPEDLRIGSKKEIASESRDPLTWLMPILATSAGLGLIIFEVVVRVRQRRGR
ncbi:MAG: DUF3592 domain-containing protein [Bifidobacteriaceae bacterium]|nr:DUF3592 domain-containing protein [Bifidobacteriaceae bacterium]